MAEQIANTPNTNGQQVIAQSVLNKSRKDKFIMVLTLPDAMRRINVSQQRSNDKILRNSLQFSIYGVLAPAVHVPALETRYGAQSFNWTTHSRPDYDNVFVNFTIDNQYNNYWVIYKWLNLLNNNREAFFYKERLPLPENLGNYEQYATTITVFGLDEYNNKKIQWDYIGAVPISLGEITYNYRDEGEIESTFEFAFSQLEVKLL